MTRVPVHMGIDYHHRNVQVCVVDQTGQVLYNRRRGNCLVEIAGTVDRSWQVQSVAVESCCGAANFADALGTEAGWPVVLAHPGYVNRMKQNPDKTDFSDARMLAELSRVGFIPRVWLAPEWVRELRLLIRLRADLVSRVRTVQTRMLGVLRQQRITEPERPGRWTKEWRRWLAEEAPVSPAGRLVLSTHMKEWGEERERIREVEGVLDEHTKEIPLMQRLMEERGIGKVTAWTMLAMIGDFSRFSSGKQLARYCGLTPRNCSSGERVADSGLVRAGDPLLKSVLIEAAHRLRRYSPRWKEFSRELHSRGKPVSVIVAAIANRWVRGLLHKLKETPNRQAA